MSGFLIKEPIKDWQGKILGWVETDSSGNKILRDFPGRILGKYNRSLDITQDFYGRTVAKGDCLMMLLR